MEKYSSLLAEQKKFFESGTTLPLSFREKALRDLLKTIREHEKEILTALHRDLRKPSFEAFLSEVGILYEEIRYMLNHVRRWSRPKRVRTPFLLAVGQSHIHQDPLGQILIIGPWNYPFQLVLQPLVGAIAAGNCAVVKPSEFAPHTGQLVKKLLSVLFPREFVAVEEGGAEVSQALVKLPFNHIFYTGGPSVAKQILASAASNLTPVTLELGGKSPCLVDSTAPIATTARRITWGKFYNAGQTCIAPDYVLAPKGMQTPLVQAMSESMDHFFGKNPQQSPDYCRIINERHFDRLSSYLKQGKVLLGGGSDRKDLFIAPTVLSDVKMSDPIMTEEIFGPILPVIEYENLSEAISLIRSQPKPLAFYFFTKNNARKKEVLSQVSFGGGCVNDTLVHAFSPHLPFGGVGNSGSGHYHGKFSFDTFTHQKSVVQRAWVPDLALRYPPYKKRLGLAKKLVDLF